jgi:hypothetical protein
MSTFAARDKRCRNEWVVQAQGAAWSWAWSALRRCHWTPSRGESGPLRDLAETESEDP